jgi:hypothetical protein
MKESPQPLIHLEAAVVQMATLEPGERLAELLQRLEALEQRLGAGAGAAGSTPSRGGTPSRSAGPAPSPARTAGAPPAPARIAAPASPAYAPPMSAAVPPPSAPRAAAPVPATAATATLDAEPADAATYPAAWEATVIAVNTKKRMLGAFLQACRFAGVEEGTVVLAMDDLHRAVVDEKENRALIAATLSECFGRPLAVRCVASGEGAAAPPSDADVRPMIERAIAWFEGEVIEPSSTRPERTRGS